MADSNRQGGGSLLHGKVALVTGGGGGIGRGVARRFVREGAAVVVAEIDEAAGARTVEELRSELGGEAVFIRTDVGRKDDVLAAVQMAADRFGGLDILVNNAFAPTPEVLFEHKTDEMLQSCLNTGIWAAWWAMRAALPRFKARGGGQVVNFYSIDAQVGAWMHADYNIVKSALLGLTRSAAAEWGRFNVRVNAVAPTAAGAVFERLCREIPGFREASAARKPLGRPGDPENDIGPVVVFLASEMSRYVTGELINVDGGLHLPGYQSRPANLAELEQQQP